MCTYAFVVTYLEEDLYEDFKYNTKIKQGVTCADSYTEALKNLADWYGDDEIINVTLEYLEETRVIEVSKEELDKIKEDLV